MTSEPKRGARLAAECIASMTDRVYGLCGGHVQPIWDELADTSATIVDVRDERAAVHAAQADAEVGDGLGVALVTAGPGLTNAVTGMANAETTRVPLLVVTGAPPIPQTGRGALQEIPQRSIVEPLVAVTRRVVEAGRIPGHLQDAGDAALDERKPAYVEVPTDVLAERARPDRRPRRATRAAYPDPSDADVERAVAVLEGADRPVVVAGRGTRSDEAVAAVRSFVEAARIPFLPTAGSSGVLPESHELWVPAARGKALEEADAVVLLGKRRDFAIAYGSEAVFGETTFVQVDVDRGALRQNGRPDVPIHGSVSAVAERLADRVRAPVAEEGWVADLRAVHEERGEKLDRQKRNDDEPLHPYRVCGAIERVLGDDAVVVCDGGDALSFGRIAIRPTGPRGYLDPGPLGCLGVGVPFAIGANAARPDADVVCFTGDGALGFNVSEIETAVRVGANLTVVVANNAAWNIERHDQVERYGREVGSTLTDVRYDVVAEGLGAKGRRVESAAELDEAVAEAVGSDGVHVVDVAVDPEAVSPDARNGLAGVPTYQALRAWDEKEREHRTVR